eukprot:GEZU01002945.1.p1 GENE.GEZU01002945.1~~GEZU01002945.1.p1  ORF type:complete len:106 (+),score=21.62 GEZU01002945.1:222-539(+)
MSLDDHEKIYGVPVHPLPEEQKEKDELFSTEIAEQEMKEHVAPDEEVSDPHLAKLNMLPGFDPHHVEKWAKAHPNNAIKVDTREEEKEKEKREELLYRRRQRHRS